MLGAETEEKLFDAPLSISKREQLEQQVEMEGVCRGGVQRRVCQHPQGLLRPCSRPAVHGFARGPARCPKVKLQGTGPL